MMYYFCHDYSGNHANITKARKSLARLQKNDLANCYLCPVVAFPIFENPNIDNDSKMELCYDLMTLCDAVIVGYYITDEMAQQIEFARLIKMEVLSVDSSGKIQPFSQ
jgi:hypothetical protein